MSAEILKDLRLLTRKFPILNNTYDDKKKHHIDLCYLTKKAYCNTVIISSQNKSRTCWSTVNGIFNRRKKNNNPFRLLSNGKIISEPGQIANVFNNHFVSAPQAVAGSVPNVSTRIDSYIPIKPGTMALVGYSAGYHIVMGGSNQNLIR